MDRPAPVHSDQEISHHLFLSRNALLVSLPPGWVVQVAECLVPSCDTRRAEKLRRPKEAGSGCLSWSPGPHHEATAHRQGPVFPFFKRCVLVGGRAGIGTRGAISQSQELHLRAERNLKTAMMAEEVAGWGVGGALPGVQLL